MHIPVLYKFAKQKQKYRGMFETQKSRNKTSSGDIGLNIRTIASPKAGQDQAPGGASVPRRHAAPAANAPRKPLAIRQKAKFGYKVKISNRVKIGVMPDQWRVSLLMVIIQNVV